MSWELSGRPLRRILVTRLRYLGDVVMSTVVLEALRRGDPDLRLGYLCEEPYGDVLRGHPLLDEVHLLGSRRHGADARARPGLDAATAADSTVRGTLGTIAALRRRRYDLAVDLFFNPRSAWLLWLAGIGLRICGTERSRRRLYTHSVPGAPAGRLAEDLGRSVSGVLATHLGRLAPLVHRPSGLGFGRWFAETIGGERLRPRLTRPGMSPAAAGALASVSVATHEAFLLLAPGATWPSKAWPLARWRDLVADLAARPEMPPLVVLCAPGQVETWHPLAAEIPPGRGGVLPPLALPTVLSLVAASRTLVTVDGGVMHAAVAMGVPTLALFGPTSPDDWFPYEACGPYRVLATRPTCHPCDRHDCDAFVCLPDLGADLVGSALRDLLAQALPAETERA